MNNLSTYIIEKLKKISSKNVGKQYNYCPKTRRDLINIIDKLLEERGNEADLNDIDTSKITTMYNVFKNSDFDGDISDWDVSNVTSMVSMFDNSKFTGKNGDISNWDVSNVGHMAWMFYKSSFNGNIDNWKISDFCDVYHMFLKCPLEKKLPKWWKGARA